VDELDRHAGGDRRLLARGRREEDEQGPQPLAPGGERLVADRRDEARMTRDRPREPLLECVEVALETGGLADRSERLGCRGRQRVSPT
jgi:hypothetical protein